MVHLYFTKPLVLVAESDGLPPGIPSPTGRPLLMDNASSSAWVREGRGGPQPVLRASAFFLLAT